MSWPVVVLLSILGLPFAIAGAVLFFLLTLYGLSELESWKLSKWFERFKKDPKP